MIILSAERIGVNNMTRFTIKKYASTSVNQLPWALQIRGFNLIELIVVLAIVGLLSVAARLSYTKYIAHGNLTESLGVINNYQAGLMSAYAHGQQFPTTMDDLTANSYTALTYDTVNLVYYGLSANKQAAYLRLYTTNTNIAGATPSSVTQEGTYSRLSVVISVTSDGHFNVTCGQWGAESALDIPTQYLPSSCTSSNLAALIS